MRTPPLILIVDDNAANVDIIETRLGAHGYETIAARDGVEGLATARERLPDLILLDVMMPKMNGIEVTRQLKDDDSLPFMPVILVTARSEVADIVKGLEAGADEYLTKPVDHAALVARVKSMLRIKVLHDTTRAQAEELVHHSARLDELNATLERRVEEQVVELNRLSQLKRFFSPPVAELIVASGGDRMIEDHRCEITALFCDLRGFTAFSETGEHEDVMRVLREYHAVVGKLVKRYDATLEHFAGDGFMVFFNDPTPCPDPAARAVRMAVAAREGVNTLKTAWRRRGHDLGIGVGIAAGYATLGQVGFEGVLHYAAIGTVANLAARLCDQAGDGQILLTERVYAEIEGLADVEPVGELELKGFQNPVRALNVVALRDAAD